MKLSRLTEQRIEDLKKDIDNLERSIIIQLEDLTGYRAKDWYEAESIIAILKRGRSKES